MKLAKYKQACFAHHPRGGRVTGFACKVTPGVYGKERGIAITLPHAIAGEPFISYPVDQVFAWPPPADEPASRFFIARSGTPVTPHCDQGWTEWGVGDNHGRDRLCLTSTKANAQLIAAALEAFHQTKP